MQIYPGVGARIARGQWQTIIGMRLLCLFMVAGIGMQPGLLDAAPGDLDPDFGDHGRVQLRFNGGLDYMTGTGPAIVRQPDGQLLIARTDQAGSDWMDSEVALARLQHDGTLDPGFGSDGMVRLRFRGGEASGVGGLALLPDGRVLVVGYTITAWEDGGVGDRPNLDTGIALVRPDGSLDPDGFGNGGRIALDLSEAGRTDLAVAAVVLEDGHIVVAGTAESATGTRFVMVRMMTQGTVDPSFGKHDGLAWAYSFPSLGGFHRSASGQFVVCGGGRITRFDSAGGLIGETDLNSADIQYVTACAPQEDGSVVVGGNGRAGDWLARVTPDGRLDPEFGDRSGRTALNCVSCGLWDQMGYPRVPTDIAFLADGRLAVAMDGYGWGNVAILSFASDGRSDTRTSSLSGDRFFDVGWGELPPSASASKLLSTDEGDMLAVVAGGQSTTVIRLQASARPGASVIGLQGDFWQQSESHSSGLLVCRSGSTDGAVTVNFASRDETAQSPDDYVPTSGLLAWSDGETGCREIPITVKVDNRREPEESLWVELTNPIGAGLAMDKARLYIVDGASPAPGPAPGPTPRADSDGGGGGGAAGSALFMMLAALACRRSFAQLAVTRCRRRAGRSLTRLHRRFRYDGTAAS